jgi:putative oxidoreductase
MTKFIYNSDLGLLIFRLFVGLAMAFSHGLGKMPPPEQLIAGVESMGFPMAIAFAWAAALSEFVGALLLASGLFTRISASLIAVTMAVAGFIVHGADPFAKKEMALLYLAASVMFIFTGAGKYSLDSIVRKK